MGKSQVAKTKPRTRLPVALSTIVHKHIVHKQTTLLVWFSSAHPAIWDVEGSQFEGCFMDFAKTTPEFLEYTYNNLFANRVSFQDVMSLGGAQPKNLSCGMFHVCVYYFAEVAQNDLNVCHELHHQMH